ncbi:hypothetical protein Pmani_005308 [Petrolisthes manimaculis]|uniref:Uncharacterized protein n=1 Tax=Petrolisthes manimaculis TaxID=1843537 RepID=A0AAE1UMB5_9EUCA|nr:hypothetical protein Pmani_005308 [Petrolisthes manimaculis]
MRSMHQYTTPSLYWVYGPALCGLVYWCGAPHLYQAVNTLLIHTPTSMEGVWSLATTRHDFNAPDIDIVAGMRTIIDSQWTSFPV